MKWTILVLTQPSRSEFLKRLMANLVPQVERYPDVEIITTLFDKELSMGKNRAKMIESATGEYVNFVDDDDLVAEDYAVSIRPRLDGVDYVGFIARLYRDGVFCGKQSYHSLLYNGWFENDYGYFRDLSHLNPIRRELAVAGKMGDHEGLVYEDLMWADRLRSQKIVKTEHFIPKPMYFAYYRSNKTDSYEVHESYLNSRFGSEAGTIDWFNQYSRG